MVLIQEVKTLLSVNEVGGLLCELYKHDLKVGKGEERNLELLIPNQTIAHVVLSLRRCSYLSGSNNHGRVNK